MADYIPSDGAELVVWARAFASHISAAPAKHGLQTEEATAIARAVETYAQAFALAKSLDTRTRGNVFAKNSARKAMLKLLRQYGQLIKASPAVSEQAKVELKLTRPSGRTPIRPPSGRPMIHIVSAQPLRHLLRFTHVGKAADGSDQSPKKPADAIGLQLFCHVGSEPPTDPQDARFERFVSRKSHTVQFKHEQVGKRAYYFARWQTATGETGPWSQVLSMTVAG